MSVYLFAAATSQSPSLPIDPRLHPAECLWWGRSPLICAGCDAGVLGPGSRRASSSKPDFSFGKGATNTDMVDIII